MADVGSSSEASNASPGDQNDVEESPQPPRYGEEEEDTTEEPESATSTARAGTTASARFNILSTMVGGGSLSLPLAFQKSGNALTGPLILIGVAIVTEYCFRILVRCTRTLHPVTGATLTPGSDSFESIAAAAFGPKALAVTKGLVVLMCFFGTVGYAVLLRDMLEPISSAIYHTKAEGPSWEGNSVMLTVVLLVTPLCTLKTLTALKRFGAASMFSVLILGSCVLFRSLQCNIREASSDWKAAFRLFPESWRDILDVIPLYISCYVCHYNILTVHNEFRKPSAERISWWLSSTTWSATLFYLVLGFSGSAYSTCTADGSISGNILLDFPENDPLLLVGRMCLAITITLAFPMLTIPARDIVIRSIVEARSSAVRLGVELTDSEDLQAALAEPLLDESGEEANPDQDTTANPATPTTPLSASLSMRLGIAIILFWSAALMASCVESIDLVWDLLGSSLSILLSYSIPCGSYIYIMRDTTGIPSRGQRVSVAVAWVLIFVSTPLMIVSTANAVHNTFF